MRRMKPRNVMMASLIAAVICLVVAALLVGKQSWWAALPGLLTVWFAIDAYRASGWVKDSQELNKPS